MSRWVNVRWVDVRVGYIIIDHTHLKQLSSKNYYLFIFFFLPKIIEPEKIWLSNQMKNPVIKSLCPICEVLD